MSKGGRPRKEPTHGTVAGYHIEYRRMREGLIDQPCEACRKAWSRYNMAMRTRRKGDRILAQVREKGISNVPIRQVAWLEAHLRTLGELDRLEELVR